MLEEPNRKRVKVAIDDANTSSFPPLPTDIDA